MSINPWAEVFLAITIITTVGIYIETLNPNYPPRKLSKWFIVGLGSFGSFFFAILPWGHLSITPEATKLVLISFLFGSVFIAMALWEISSILIERIKRKI